MRKINNNEMRDFTTNMRSFTNNTESVFTNNSSGTDLYVVYSYGYHFPMYVFDHVAQMWFGNSSKYSPTTTRHQTLARPDADEIEPMDTAELTHLVQLGGYRQYCADRCVENVLSFGRRK